MDKMSKNKNKFARIMGNSIIDSSSRIKTPTSASYDTIVVLAATITILLSGAEAA